YATLFRSKVRADSLWVDASGGARPAPADGCKRRREDLLRAVRVHQPQCADRSGRDHTGPPQMVNANNEARRALQAGRSSTEAIQAAKSVGAFSGEPLRSNLINQLNHWGFHKWLGLGDSADLFSTSRHLVQTTSLLRYPVFVKDDDYRGSPDMT